ncbi:MAG: hypothetical protein HZC54_10665 [Verrucomicrobia bacterium]|nr:hypothetical protein [Verrucomicrobiota bacterium]
MQKPPATKSSKEPGNASVSLTAAEWGLAAGALPAIAVGTGAPIGLAHWVLMAHYLAIAYGCHILRTTRLFPDALTLFRNGCLLLTAGSLACAAAPDAYTLVAARLPQAFGIACLLAARPMGNGSWLPIIPSIIGLLAGSLIGNLIGWRVVFLLAASMGFVAAVREWRRETHGCDSLEVHSLPQQPSQRHPMLLACGLACIIVPFNAYCDFRTFGLAEAILLLVGVVLFAVYARQIITNLVASRSTLLTLWLGAVVAGLCLLPALFHIREFSAPVPALGIIVCGLVLQLTRHAPPHVGRFAPVAGFLIIAGALWETCSWAGMESVFLSIATAAAVGAGLGLTWTGSVLRPVPLFSGLAVGIYAASYFLEFIPASACSMDREFLREESTVLRLAAGIALAGLGWSLACALTGRTSQA